MSATIRECKAFISASFDNSAQKPIEWFIKMANSLEIEPIWLKSMYETRPVEDKIKHHLKRCNAFIQILTEDVEELNERGWLGNEVGWADSYGIENFALFVEEGVNASGVIATKTEPLSFDRNAIDEIAPKVNQYLLDLKSRTSKKTSISEAKECLSRLVPP